MKDSKKYSTKVQKLYRKLHRQSAKVQRVTHERVVDAVVCGIISAEFSEKVAASAMKRFADYFVDWNDLRVSRAEEIFEVLGEDGPVAKAVASMLKQVLQGIFDGYNEVSLEALRKTGKRPARQALEKIDGISRFVVDYCMLTSLQGHAIPLTGRMIEYLKTNDLVAPEADEQQIAGFLAKQVSAKNGYEFYALLRRESEARRSRKKKKTKTAVRKKTKKKTATKKKTTAKRKTTAKKKTKKKKTSRRKA